MDNFHNFTKKQLIEFIEKERQKGVPLEEIENTLLNAGHNKNIIDEVILELEKEEAGRKKTKHKDPVEKDLISQLKNAFSQFMAQASGKEIKEAKKEAEDSDEIIEEVIEEAEYIEEKTMLESFSFFLYLVGLAIVILFTAGSTDSVLIKVIIGFLPAILNAFVSLMAVKLADNVPLYMFIPLIIASAFYGFGKYSGLALFQGMDIESLSIVNFLFGLFFNVMIVYVRFMKPKKLRKRKIPELKLEKPVQEKKVESREEIQDLKKEFDL